MVDIFLPPLCAIYYVNISENDYKLCDIKLLVLFMQNEVNKTNKVHLFVYLMEYVPDTDIEVLVDIRQLGRQ
jgi:hypothetical protein